MSVKRQVKPTDRANTMLDQVPGFPLLAGFVLFEKEAIATVAEARDFFVTRCLSPDGTEVDFKFYKAPWANDITIFAEAAPAMERALYEFDPEGWKNDGLEPPLPVTISVQQNGTTATVVDMQTKLSKGLVWLSATLDPHGTKQMFGSK